nr:ATP-binding protein [Gemmatimonadaceae bacterium]
MSPSRPARADRASRRELALLYEHLPAAIAMFARRPDGRLGVASANRRMLDLARTLGLGSARVHRGAALGELLGTLTGLHDGGARALLAGLDEAITQRRQTVITLDALADGALDLAATIVPVTGRTGPLRLVLLTLRDITEERAAAARQRALEEQLARSEKLTALGTLAGGLAHDFGNVLTGIAGHAELLQLDVEGNPGAEESLAQIFAGVRRAQGLVHQVLAFAPVRLDALVRESLAFLAGRIPPNVGVTVDQRESPAVLGDATQLTQAFDNLVTNAVQAMGDEGGTLTITVDTVQLPGAAVTGGAPERHARLRIRDTGPGIPAAQHARIFEPFFTTKGTGRGTGLGLAVVHGVIEAHDGMISVESEPGHGACFT